MTICLTDGASGHNTDPYNMCVRCAANASGSMIFAPEGRRESGSGGDRRREGGKRGLVSQLFRYCCRDCNSGFISCAKDTRFNILLFVANMIPGAWYYVYKKKSCFQPKTNYGKHRYIRHSGFDCACEKRARYYLATAGIGCAVIINGKTGASNKPTR